MKKLIWSQMKSGVWNGKIGPYTLFTVAWHTGENRWFVASKLPGRLTWPVGSEEEGKKLASSKWMEFLNLLVETKK